MDQGNVTGGMFPRSGSFDGKRLTLDEDSWPIEAIVGTHCDTPTLSLQIEQDDDWEDFSIAVSGVSALVVKQAIDAARSKYDVAQEQTRLIEEGQGDSFRSEICPHCGASTSLSRFADSPQCFCSYCETLFTIRKNQTGFHADPKTLDAELEPKYRICEHCEMYSYPKKFRIFYFVFLLYFMHFASEKTVRCPACMRWEAWKMLMANIFGLLGLPTAITQLSRSYRSRVEKGPLRGLDDANILANRGKIDRALDRYDLLMDNVPINAGIKYNIAAGLMKKDDLPHAETMFLLSLEDCANYEPSLSGLYDCYQRSGKTRELKELEFRMGYDRVDYVPEVHPGVIEL